MEKEENYVLNAPKVKFVDGGKELELEGNFEFKVGKTYYSPINYAPYKQITFGWCPNVPQKELSIYGEEKLTEAISEKLKQDFIIFINKNSIQNDTTNT